jgi:hypothetical protein
VPPDGICAIAGRIWSAAVPTTPATATQTATTAKFRRKTPPA